MTEVTSNRTYRVNPEASIGLARNALPGGEELHQLIDFEIDGDTVRSLCTCEWVSPPELTRWDAGMQWGRHRDDAHWLVVA